MRTLIAAAIVAVLASGCSSGPEDARSDLTELSASEAMNRTCAEVRAGIDEFNRQDYAATVDHFEKARTTARIYARVDDEPEADALLDAVEYYANLAPEQYPDAARTSENFARNKAITLGQCASDGPIDEVAPTPV
jgi:hypothetical protein